MVAIRKIGVSFTDGKFQVAEIEHGKKPAITALAESETAIDFAKEGSALTGNHPKLETFAQELRSVIKANKITAEKISFALPSAMLFLHLVPQDKALKDDELKKHVLWEVSNYIEEDPESKNLIITSTPLHYTLGGIKQMLIVCLKKGIVAFIQKVCAESGLTRDKVEIDHLSVEKCIQFNYPEVKGYPTALVGVKGSFIDASLLVEGETVDYRNFVGNDVRKTILDYMKYLNERDVKQAPAALFLYGLDVPAEMRLQLRKEADTQVVQMNVLRKLPPPKKFPEEYKNINAQFAAAVGLALRVD